MQFRRAMRRVIQNAMRLGAEGIKVRVAGRLGGAKLHAQRCTTRVACRRIHCELISTTQPGSGNHLRNLGHQSVDLYGEIIGPQETAQASQQPNDKV